MAAPQLRGLLATQLKRDFTIAVAFGIGATMMVQIFIKGARKTQYEEFYKTYDAQADFERMKKAGVFKSVLSDGSVGTGW